MEWGRIIGNFLPPLLVYLDVYCQESIEAQLGSQELEQHEEAKPLETIQEEKSQVSGLSINCSGADPDPS